jgi:DNA-binding NarL/FixJ family response regulator
MAEHREPCRTGDGSIVWNPVAVRVVIAEDHLLVREGMQRILETSREVVLAAAVADGDALEAAIVRERPDVVVTDVRMPPSDDAEGIRVARDGRERFPEMGVLVLSQYADPAYALALFRDGSSRRGYLLKDRLLAPGELVEAICDIAAGGSVVDPVIVEALVSSRLQAEASPLRTLTRREREILAELAAGKSNAAIAQSLVITRRAVEHHITAIFAKLGLPDESEVSRRVRAALLYLADRDAAIAHRASED